MAKRQSELPEMEGPGVGVQKYKDIDAAADHYVEVRDKRMALTEKEIAAREEVTVAMQAHGLLCYNYDDMKVELISGKPRVRVRNAESPEDASDED